MKLFSTKYTEAGVSLGVLLLRLVAGATMLFNHGLKKLSGFNTLLEKGFADPFHVGMKASLSLTIFAEVFCAALILLGLLTRLATLPLIIAMAVALFYAHGGQIFGDGEMAALFLAMYTTLLLTGPGKYSIDKMLRK